MQDLEILINGRFFTRPPTGVERTAQQTLLALQKISNELQISRPNISIALPNNGKTPTELSELKTVDVWTGKLSGHLWEQFELPLKLGGKWLYNPCNTAPILRRRHLVTIHDAQVYTTPNSYSKLFRMWYKVMLPTVGRRAQIVTTVSEFSKMQLEQYGVVPPSKIHVVPNGVDHIDHIADVPNSIKKFNLPAQSYILAIGSLSPHKNLQLLIDAAKNRPKGSAKIVIAGGGNSNVFKDAGLHAREDMCFLGRVTDVELKALYKNALALAFPSITEGFGLPPLEAMRCGCPVIASTGGAIPEACGDAALFANPFNQQDWSKALLDIENTPVLRFKLIEKGYRQSSPFTWRRTALDILRLIAKADDNAQLLSEIKKLSAQNKNNVPKGEP